MAKIDAEVYNRKDLLIDVIGYIHLEGESADYKQLMEYGYSKAEIVDFCLGMSIPAFNDEHESIFEQSVDSTAISPKNMDCLCGRNFALVDEIYRYHDGDKPEKRLNRDDYLIMCGECLRKTRMLEGLSPQKSSTSKRAEHPKKRALK